MTIYEDDHDRLRFLRLLGEQQAEFGVKILAESQMGNHFHAVVTVPEGNLSDFMEQLQGQFAQYSNRRHHNVGHLFQARFKAVPIQDDVQLLTALCYVFMNPVAAGFVEKPESWRWSSYAATVGMCPVPGYLTIDWLESFYPSVALKVAQERFRALMGEGRPVQSYLLQCEQHFDEQSITRIIRSYVGRHLYEGPVPPLYSEALRPEFAQLVPAGLKGRDLEAALYRARYSYHYRVAEIARFMQLHPNSVSRLLKKAKKNLGSQTTG